MTETQLPYRPTPRVHKKKHQQKHTHTPHRQHSFFLCRTEIWAVGDERNDLEVHCWCFMRFVDSPHSTLFFLLSMLLPVWSFFHTTDDLKPHAFKSIGFTNFWFCIFICFYPMCNSSKIILLLVHILYYLKFCCSLLGIILSCFAYVHVHLCTCTCTCHLWNLCLVEDLKNL